MTTYTLYASFPTHVYIQTQVTCKNVYFLTNNLASLLTAIFTDLGSPAQKIKNSFKSSLNITRNFTITNRPVSKLKDVKPRKYSTCRHLLCFLFHSHSIAMEQLHLLIWVNESQCYIHSLIYRGALYLDLDFILLVFTFLLLFCLFFKVQTMSFSLISIQNHLFSFWNLLPWIPLPLLRLHS